MYDERCKTGLSGSSNFVNVATGCSNLSGANMATVGPADPVIRERIDGYVKRIYNCLNYAESIEVKIFSPTPSNGCPTGERSQTQSIESLLYELDRLSLDLEDTLGRINLKL